MKKLIHLSVIAFFAIGITSCSKSANDLEPNEKAASIKDAAPSSTQIAGSNYGTIIETETEIYNYINQPGEIELGVPGTSIIKEGDGEFAVFYVMVSPDYINEEMKQATLSTANSVTGEIIYSYELINTRYAESYGVNVPERLRDLPAMFAVVNLKEGLAENANVPINLYSAIVNEKGTLVSKMSEAFTYVQ